MPRSLRPSIKLVCRRQRWVLTAQGWLVTLFCLVLLMMGTFFNLYPFLAVKAPIQADALVVEGWLQDESLKAAITEFRSQPYKLLITTGGPLPIGFYLAEYKTYAEIAAATITKLGFEQEKLIAVPAERVTKDRTNASVIAVKQWLSRDRPDIRSINLWTQGPHARRSWLLYRKTLEPAIQVGIIPTPDPEYDPQRWWASSAGTRTVMAELIAYLYARIFSLGS
jgi:hypothetical protein